MVNQKHVRLDNFAVQLTVRLKRLAGAYRLGNLSKKLVLVQAEKLFYEFFDRILVYVRKVPVSRDLGKNIKNLSDKDVSELKKQVSIKLEDFQKIIDDLKPYLAEAIDWWGSLAGIDERLSMIGLDFTYRIYNNALAVYGNNNFSSLEWVGYPDACKRCQDYIGRIYRLGQYLPILPKHVFCRCTWRLIPK